MSGVSITMSRCQKSNPRGPDLPASFEDNDPENLSSRLSLPLRTSEDLVMGLDQTSSCENNICWVDEDHTRINTRAANSLEGAFKNSNTNNKNETSTEVPYNAIERGQIGSDQVLLQEGSSIEISSCTNDNIFYVATTKENINANNYLGEPTLYNAIKNGNAECVRTLLQKGAAKEISSIDMDNVFHIAVRQGHVDILKLLIDHDEKFTKKYINNVNCFLKSPICEAVENGLTECVRILLQNGAFIDSTIADNSNILQIAAKSGDVDLLKLLLNYDKIFTSKNINKKNWLHETALLEAIERGHIECVRILLQKGAMIEIILPDKSNVLHIAAKRGYVELLKLLLDHDEIFTGNHINNKKWLGKTALHEAIENDHTECVRILLQRGAFIEITLPDKSNVFHIAAKKGNVNLLKLLLDHDETFTKNEINAQILVTGFAPIHCASLINNSECVKLLLSKNASINLKTSDHTTLLHLAAKNNNVKFAEFIIKYEYINKYSETVNRKYEYSMIFCVNKLGWSPLHTACCHGSKDVAMLLILNGAKLSACTNSGKTAVQMLMDNFIKPTEFLESIFDTCILVDKNNGIKESEVIVDYSILVPENKIKTSNCKIKVIEALLNTGNSHAQKRLLIHPLVESLICIKWKAVIPFFYAMLSIHILFVLTLTFFVMTHFGYKDSNTEQHFMWETFWMYALYIAITIVLMQEAFFFSLSFKTHLYQKETLVKLTFTIMAIILPNIIEKNPSSTNTTDTASVVRTTDTMDWSRNVATTAILLSWLFTTAMISKFPVWGCNVLIFSKVFSNMLKILLTFVCIIVGFALSFMIALHHQESFDSFWGALIKTMVMMTSEFDYDDLVKGKDPGTLVMIRIVFLIFLILAPIVLMNLMVGVAASDFNGLEISSRIMQLEMQVKIINNISALLETVNNKLLKRLLSKKLASLVSYTLILEPSKPTCKMGKVVPERIKDAIFKKALEQETSSEQLTNQPTESAVGIESLKKQVDNLSAKFDLMMEMLIQMKDQKKNKIL